MRAFGLSKSKITAFEQCEKRLWLATHRADLAQQDEGAEGRFAMGHQVGAVACALLPDGVMVEATGGLGEALAMTKTLLEGDHDGPIFEATLEHDGVLVRIDVLEPEAGGGWHMAEVKSSTAPKGYHLGDLATQLWVARETGLEVKRASIRHIDNRFVLRNEGDYVGLFADAPLLEEAGPIIEKRPAVVARARAILAGSEPAISPGSHCEAPFPCEFAAYCHRDTPAGPEWPVTVLPHGGGKRWLGEGIADLLDVDENLLTNPTHQKVHRATVTGEVFHDLEGAKAAMSGWAYPRTWLDFETIGFAVPRWVGTRPFEQSPFQFSAHVEDVDGAIDHREFLSLDGCDPRRPCAEALASMVPPTGAVIAYNASFERGRLMELAAAFPDLAPTLTGIAERLVDLLPVTRAHWYHRDQRGSWSIKAVLPTVAPDLDYADLEVSDGGNAQAAYVEAASQETSAERRAQLDTALRTYCGRDTWAMIVLADHLVGQPRRRAN